jgi:DNA polymerase
MHLFIDFETFSEVDLKKTSVWNYAAHESTDILCLAYAIDDDPVDIWIAGTPLPAWFLDISEYTIHAHNAQFESVIWEVHCVPQKGWPAIDPMQWRCTAARAAAAALPRSLDKCAKALGLKIQKDNDGHRAMLRLCKPNPQTKRRIAYDEEPERFERMYDYCKNDVEVERAIYKATPLLSEAEEVVWRYDQRLNRRGIPIDIESVNNAIAIADRYSEERSKRVKEITGGVIATQRDKFVEWLNKRGINVDNIRAATVEKLLRDNTISEDVREVLQARQDLSKASIKKYDSMKNWASDGRVKFAHMYHGASTGRWAGVGVQFQNVARGAFNGVQTAAAIEAMKSRDPALLELVFGDVTTTLSNCLRAMVCAPEGKSLYVIDFAAIEARVLAWLAGDTPLLEAFRQGVDPYVQMAAKLYHVDPADVTKAQRFVGKICILGLGYGMGGETFQKTCATWGAGDLDREFCDRAVDLYRTSHPAIKRYWYAIDDSAKAAVKNPGRLYQCGKKIDFRVVRGWLATTLPNGRKIRYYDPQIRDVEASWGNEIPSVTYMGLNFQHQWERQNTYGGKLAENCTQAVARDLLVEAMGRLERAGYQVIFHVHDEMIVEHDSGVPIETIEGIVEEVPAWARGCPVNAEGFVSQRYRK